MDAETKKKVIPELMPRTLWWFRWGALFTWISGLMLLLIIYYHQKLVLADPQCGFSGMTIVGIVLTFLAVIGYDILYKVGLGKNPFVGAIVSLILASGVFCLFKHVFGFGERAAEIHMGAMFGTMMAFNVWMRIWPAQRRIITAIKNGEAPNPADPAMAGTRSKHNTYMSVPLLFFMVSLHGYGNWVWTHSEVFIPVIIAVGWAVTYCLYKKAAKVPGF